MLINWFTVLAQLVNFLILVYLLKRFLYGPIIKAMDEREKKVSDTLKNARKAEKEARDKSNEIEKERNAFESAREQMMTEAREEVSNWRKKTIEDTRAEIEDLREKWVNLLDQEKDVFIKGVRKTVISGIMKIGEKVLNDLAREDIEKQIITVFLEKLSENSLDMVKNNESSDLIIETGFSLDETMIRESRERIMKLLPNIKSVDFQVSGELGIGVRTKVGDNRVEWNLTSYLKEFEKEIFKDLSRISPENA